MNFILKLHEKNNFFFFSTFRVVQEKSNFEEQVTLKMMETKNEKQNPNQNQNQNHQG